MASTLQHYNLFFQKELDCLNEAQREAVDNIEGPVLVIAGPGTGKTHILTARIGRILLETDAAPHNILCLTFTEAGVHAMRERLLEFIGPEAHRVHIYTFHSFCNSIIQDNLELFGRHDLEPLSDLERVEMIRRIIDELDYNHPLKLGKSDVYFYENHLHGLFQMMKAENWSVAFMDDKIDEYLEDLPNRKEFIYQVNRGDFQKGDLKPAKMDEAIQRMERLRAAVKLFPRYLSMQRAYRRYDFDDMILWVLRAFERNTALLRTYQEQYLYFLIDEYQDTNGAQNEIVLKLIEYWKNPNIFIVGDDDQSIYEFQGARLKNLIDFYERYEAHLKLVLLQENYRSSQHILDTSSSLIIRNEKRIVNNLQHLGIQKVLTAQHPDFVKIKVLPQIIEYPNRLQEAVGIVQQIEILQSQKFPLEEVAIIYAKHKQSESLVALLEKKSIPYNTRRKVNILDLPMIQNLRMLLEYLQAEFSKPYSGEYLIFKILHFDFLGISPNDLAKISAGLSKYERQDRPTWYDTIRAKSVLKKLDLEALEPLFRFAEFLTTLLAQFNSLSVNILLERLVNRSGLLQYIIASPDKIWRLQILNTFVDFVKKESNRHPRLTIAHLLETLKNMDGNRLAIEINKVTQAEDGVNLLTAHSSKGLEFRQVFLFDCVKDSWEPSNRRSSYRFPFPDTLTFSGEEDALEARRRLFYVAMTRAKERLHISYSQQDNRQKDLHRAIFLDEILKDSALNMQQKSLNVSDLINAQALMLQEVPPQLPAQNKTIVDLMLQGFTLSVSAMNKYLRCPLSFYYENVLSVPTMSSEAANYGTAMHNALERGFAKMRHSKGQIFPSAEAFVRLFEYEMQKLEGYFSRKEYERRLAIGRQNMNAYHKQQANKWHKKVRLEYEVKNVEVNGVPLTGTIDRLELHRDAIARIVDYKTGSHDASKIKRPQHFDLPIDLKLSLDLKAKKQRFGGNYWRQLVFYKILYENHRSQNYRVRTGEISYLDPDAKGKFLNRKIEFTAEEVAFVKALIQATYTQIQAHNFYKGCGEASCSWCNFVKQNVLVDSFSTREIEELDDGR